MGDTEDHVAYLCEVMRYLIAGDDVGVANLSGKLYSVHDLLAPKLAADDAPIIAARAEQKARTAAIIAAARASIQAQCAALASPALKIAAE